jgi:hypothetical protein
MLVVLALLLLLLGSTASLQGVVSGLCISENNWNLIVQVQGIECACQLPSPCPALQVQLQRRHRPLFAATGKCITAKQFEASVEWAATLLCH